MFKIDCNSSVVEYGFAREVIYILGYGATRTGDDMMIYPEKGNYSLYVKPGTQDHIAKFVVDEGAFSNCLTRDGLIKFNLPHHELVDFRAFLELIVKRYSPNYKPASCEYMGRGRTQDHYIAECVKEIKRVKEETPENEMFIHFEF